MTDRTLVQELADWAAAVECASLPGDVRRKATQRVVDIVGLCLAARDLDTSRAVIDLAVETGGSAQSTAIGADVALPAAAAAFVNGVLAHSLDYDDTHLPSILHPSASVVPAALAVGEAVDANGDAVLAAIVVGVEVCVRVGMAGYDREARQSTYFEHGQHATSICGTLGAAAAAAQLLDLGAAGIADAVAIAASMGSGIIEANRTGGTVKRLHCGWAAQAGVTAALLTGRGITGPPTALEGRFGFFEAWLRGRYDAAEITLGLGEQFAVASLHDKPYPANHFTHAVADAAIELRERGITAADIGAVQVEVATPTVRTIGEPVEAKRRPESGYHAKFSAPYVFTAALIGGSGLGLGHDDFTDQLAADPVRHQLMDRVQVSGSDECDALYPESLPAVVTVTTHSGDTVVARIIDNRGGPARPLDDDELQAKFVDNASRALNADAVARLRTELAALDKHKVRDVLAQLRKG